MARFEVSPAAAHELLPACQLLFADGRAEICRDRLLSDAHTSGLFVARSEDGNLHAAALVQTLPGALGVAWAPRGDSSEAIDAATSAACDWLRARGVKVCQAFASAEDVPDMIALERHGFRHTTQLVFLKKGLMPFQPDAPCGDLSGVYYTPARRERFATTILATYTGTLDCPELNAGRNSNDLIAGFALPDHPWSGYWLAEVGGADVGVFIVEFLPDQETVELSYLGVVPTERGRGYGHQLLRRVLYDASIANRSAVTLSVDARNAPAMKLYAHHGFVETGQSEVWLATWA